jgi:hypothetical protein
MTNAQLTENVETIVRSLCAHRPVTPTLGNFINRALMLLVCTTPDAEYFAIDVSAYMPPIPSVEEWDDKKAREKEEQRAKAAARQKQKQAMVVKDDTADEVDEIETTTAAVAAQ